MFKDFFTSVLGDGSSTRNLDFGIIISIILSAIALGFILSLCYIYSKRKIGHQRDFPIALIVIPTIVATIILLVSNNVSGALTIAGIFALTRFRSEQRDTEDIAYIFVTVAIGLSCGLGYLYLAATITLIMSILLLGLSLSNYAAPHPRRVVLRIVIPESINYTNAFDDLIEKYCQSSVLEKTKTTDFGTCYELTYHIILKKGVNQKELIDDFRTRNGNLTVQITQL